MEFGRRLKRRTLGEMREQKWEDLNQDCLLNIFGRLGIESLLLDVPFVCKSWRKATLNPQCWRHLDFSKIFLYYPCLVLRSRFMKKYQVKDNFPVTGFIKFVVKRSDRSATFLELPRCCTKEALLYLAEECPDLRTLLLPSHLPREHVFRIPNLVSKWKNLEFLSIRMRFQLREILTQISIHCKNFVGLSIRGACIGEDEASAIVNLLSNIKHLQLRDNFMEKKNLVMILQGCKELVHFDVRDCAGFNEGNGEILNFSYPHVQAEGSIMSDD